jgi:outer membrane usher protein
LNAYDHNALAIDTMSLPADVKIPVDHLDLTPRGRSGVLAHFPIERYRAAVMTVVDATGNPLPPGTALLHAESGNTFVVGYDGVAFIDGVAAQNHLRVQLPDRHCTAQFAFSPSNQKPGRYADLGTIICRDEKGSAP